MTSKNQVGLARGPVPEMHISTVATGCQDVAVWLPSKRPRDGRWGQPVEKVSGSQVPDLNRAALTADRQSGALGVNCDAGGRGCCLQLIHLLPAIHLVHDDRTVFL